MYYAECLHLLLLPKSAVSQKPALIQQQRHLPRVESSATATVSLGGSYVHCIVLRYQTHSLWWESTIHPPHPPPHPILQRQLQCLWHWCRAEAELKSCEVLDFYSMVSVIQNEGS